MVLHLTASQRDQIQREAISIYPNECCGIIVGIQSGDRRDVSLLQPADNSFDEGEQFHRFAISPKRLIDAERLAAERGELILGFYHSHPDHPARPSETDRQYGWPFYSYVIVSIANRDAVDMTSWVLDEETQTFSRQDIDEE